MAQPKLAVYDTSKGFSSFVKHYFAKEISIEVCTSKKKFSLAWFNDFHYCFFVVNDIEDLFNLMKIAPLQNNVVVGSTHSILEMKIKSIQDSNFTIIDLSLNKNDLLQYITAYLKHNQLIE